MTAPRKPTRPVAFRAVDANILHVHWPQSAPVLRLFVVGSPVPNNKLYATAGRVSDARGPGHTGGRVHYRTARSMAWIEAVVVDVRNHLRRAPAQFRPPLHISYIFNRVTGDAENYAKGTSDGLKEAIGIDDAHFHPVTTDKAKEQRLPKGALIEIYNQWQGPQGAA